MSLIGAHINSDIDKLIEEANKIKKKGGNIVQLFANKFSKKATEKYREFAQHMKLQKMKCVVHASYTINLAQNWDFHSWWLKQFILEIKTAHDIGAMAIVIHLGKQLNMSKEGAINNMYTALEYVLSKTVQYDTKILLETSSGQGSEMCYNLEELGSFFKKLIKLKGYKKRLGICIDTCHIFSAGYDIRGEKNIEKFFEKFDFTIGLEYVKLAHLNDSKNELGSKIDRHANYDSGTIGNASISILSYFFKDLGIPIIIETPADKITNDLETILK